VTGLSSVPVDVADAVVMAAPPTDTGDAFRASVASAIASGGCQLVLAGRDEDAAVLAGMTDELRALGAIFPSGPVDVVRATVDKADTARILGGAVDFAETAVTASGALRLAADVGWPLVLKPRRGCASRGVRVIRNVAELRSSMTRSDLAQAYVPLHPADMRPWDGTFVGGQDGEYSVQVMLGPASTLNGWCATRNTLEQGRPVIAEVVANGALADFVTSVACALASRRGTGPWNLQGRLNAYGRPCIFEVNARTTGITGMRSSLGFNEVDMLYDSFVLGRHGAVATVEPGHVLDAARWTDPMRYQYARG